ncbi:MAG: GSCFA domain-containing protein [Caulobacteraceae bacterium]
MQSIKAEDAFATLRDNKAGSWADDAPGAAVSRIHGAPARIASGYAGPKIGAASPIFAMGSCFAREIEHHLRNSGANVVSVDASLDVPEFRAAAGDVRTGFFNRFSPRSMWLEFKQAFDDLPAWTEDALLFAAGEELWDFNYRPVPALDYAPAATRLRRAVAKRLVRRAAEARVIILTLGMTEAWRHLPSGLYANIIRPAYVARHRQDFELRVLDYADTLECLEEIMALLKRVHATGEFELVVTVSPVPLGKTFRPMDVVVANAESKAVLRTAASAFVAGHANAHYFPSYEIVTYTAPDQAWLADRAHVRPELVRHIVSTFLADVYEEGFAPSALAAEAASDG